MNELPEHLPTVAELDSEIASMFSRESDLTRIQIEIASDSQSEFNARDKWIKRLDPIPVQPLDWHPPRVNRSTPVSSWIPFLALNSTPDFLMCIGRLGICIFRSRAAQC